MRTFLSYVFAGLVGGLLVVATQRWSAVTTPPVAQAVSQPRPTAVVTPPPYSYESSNSDVPGLQNTALNFTDAARRAMPVVVHISARAVEESREDRRRSNNPFEWFFGDDLFGNPFGGPQEGSGSGVIYSNDGYIITNNHVVEFADEIEVTLFDNRKFSATLVGTNEKTDLAVLKIEANNLPIVPLANSDDAKVGEWVLAVGNPFDLTSTVTAGIISAKGRSLQLLGGNDAIETFIQTDAAVNPGNSGGALVDATGALLGINTAIATRTGTFAGYSFAIPVNLVKRIVDDIIEFGSYQRPFLGVNITELTSDYARELGVQISQGVVVETLVDGGSAQFAGVQPKDIIVAVNGQAVRGTPDLQEAIAKAQVGDVILLGVNRQGEALELDVQLRGME